MPVLTRAELDEVFDVKPKKESFSKEKVRQRAFIIIMALLNDLPQKERSRILTQCVKINEV